MAPCLYEQCSVSTGGQTLEAGSPRQQPGPGASTMNKVPLVARGVCANVAELADALDLGSSGATRGSSSLPVRTSPCGLRRGPVPASGRRANR